MRPLLVRALLSLAATAAGVGLVVYFRSHRTKSARIGIVQAPAIPADLPRWKAVDGVPHGRFALTDDEISFLFAVNPAVHELDPFVYYRYKGGLHDELELSEHAGGRFTLRTSRDGYREDFDTLPAKRDLFVLVTGDSHTDGMCENAESFANVAETRLAALHPGKAIEVLNAGVSGYSFYNYLGCLEKHLPLAPDVFVVAVYGGNDFSDGLLTWSRVHDVPLPPRSKAHWDKLNSVLVHRDDSVGNAFHELLYFHEHPELVETAAEIAHETMHEVVRICAEKRIGLVVVYIPMNVEHSRRQRDTLEPALRKLELGPADFRTIDRLADGMLVEVRSAGATVIDLRDVFGDDPDRFYWSDLHIDVDGHRKIAELLVPILESLAAPILR